MYHLYLCLILFLTNGCMHKPVDQPEKDKVILAHGFGRSPSAMNKLEEFFQEKGFQVYNIGYSSLTQDMNGVKKEFFTQIDEILKTTDRKVHFVGYLDFGIPYLDVDRSAQFFGLVQYHFTKTFYISLGYRQYYIEIPKDEAIFNGSLKGFILHIGFQF